MLRVKSKQCVALLVIGMMLLMGCQPKVEKKEEPSSKQVEQSKRVAYHPTKEEIIYANVDGGQADRVERYGSLQEVGTASEMIVLGEVIGIEYDVWPDGGIHTIETIRVEEVLSGSAQVGDEIQFRHGGGYALAKDYLAACDKEARELAKMIFLKDVSEEEMQTKYLSEYWSGEKDSYAGDRSIYCFKKSSNTTFPEAYTRTNGRDSEFVQTKDGRFFSLNMPHTAEEIRSYINGESQEHETFWSKGEVLGKLGL
ncbi:MAG: hypothetical protein Q4D52_00705 [Eubacteriales bacterium]|nr:hypothetical protein [Eubacteriales bacterium]